MDLPKEGPLASRMRYAAESFNTIVEQYKQTGGILRDCDAARALGVSRSRVGQLVKAGKLETVEVRDSDGEVLVTGVTLKSLRALLTSNRKGGRPKKDT